MTRRSIAEVYDAVLDVKQSVLDTKESVMILKEHVNDRNEAIEDHIGLLESRLTKKIDDDQILRILLWKLANNPIVRWAGGVIAFTALAAVASSAWFPVLKHAITTFPYF